MWSAWNAYFVYPCFVLPTSCDNWSCLHIVKAWMVGYTRTSVCLHAFGWRWMGRWLNLYYCDFTLYYCIETPHSLYIRSLEDYREDIDNAYTCHPPYYMDKTPRRHRYDSTKSWTSLIKQPLNRANRRWTYVHYAPILTIFPQAISNESQVSRPLHLQLFL